MRYALWCLASVAASFVACAGAPPPTDSPMVAGGAAPSASVTPPSDATASPAPTASASATPAVSANTSAAPTPPLPTPRALLLTSFDAAVRARQLAAGVDPMPGGRAPALVRGLAFGMSEVEAARAVPGAGQWTTQAGGVRSRIRVDGKLGVHMVEFEFPNEGSAQRATASWGKPIEGLSGFRWALWTHPQAGVRAIRMSGDGPKRTRLEIMPFRPLEDLLASGGELAFEGRHLLDVEPEKLSILPHAREDIQMLPTEFSSGYVPLRVAKGRYTIGIDATYHRPVSDAVRALLSRHWGAPVVAKPSSPLSAPSSMTAEPACDVYPARNGIAAVACLERTQWLITITRAPRILPE